MFSQFDEISLNSKNETKDKTYKSEASLDENNIENENTLLLNENKNKNQLSRSKEITFSINDEFPKITENKIICYSRRRKFPKNILILSGYLLTFSCFITFTILITNCLKTAKYLEEFKEARKTIYNLIIIFIWITSILSMILQTDAASTDPGKQRGVQIPKFKYDENKIKKIVGGKKYILKYCETCHLIRDIRTFHCYKCGICIERHDHHCIYLSNCVGFYNYRKFLLFVFISFIHVSIIFFTCVDFFLFLEGKRYTVNGNEWIIFLMLLITIFAIFFEIFLIWLIIQHIVIIVKNRTTREFIKKKEYAIYNKGWKKNCKDFLCNNSLKEF